MSTGYSEDNPGPVGTSLSPVNRFILLRPFFHKSPEKLSMQNDQIVSRYIFYAGDLEYGLMLNNEHNLEGHVANGFQSWCSELANKAEAEMVSGHKQTLGGVDGSHIKTFH